MNEKNYFFEKLNYLNDKILDELDVFNSSITIFPTTDLAKIDILFNSNVSEQDELKLKQLIKEIDILKYDFNKNEKSIIVKVYKHSHN